MATTTAAKNGTSTESVPARGRRRNTEESGSPVRPSKQDKGIATVKVRCTGLTSLLMDPMTEETLTNLGTGIHKPIDKTLTDEQVSMAKVVRNDSGDIVIRGENFFACLVDAGRKVKRDAKSKISTLQSTTLPEFFWLKSPELVLIDTEGNPLRDLDDKGGLLPNKPWVVDKRRGRLDNGTAVSIRRPMFADWGFEVVFEYDETAIDQGKLVDLFRFAGVACGLGSFRPNKKGNFGTFEARTWEIMSRRDVVRELRIIDHTQQVV